VESTIVRVEDGVIRLLRPGGVAAEEIEKATGLQVIRPEGPAAIIEAPGMLASHYAPGAAVRLNADHVDEGEALIRVRLNADHVDEGEALIRFGSAPVAGVELAKAVFDLSPSGDLAQAAANLFDYLKQADATGAARIAVTPIPDHGLGEAINDRLARAAAPRE